MESQISVHARLYLQNANTCKPLSRAGKTTRAKAFLAQFRDDADATQKSSFHRSYGPFHYQQWVKVIGLMTRGRVGTPQGAFYRLEGDNQPKAPLVTVN